MHGTDIPQSTQTALEALTCLFFGDDVAVSEALSKPLAPAAALVLCLVANSDAAGLTHRDAQFALRFAFNPEEAGQVVRAGFAAAIEAGLAILSGADGADPAVERLGLTERGERMVDVLRNVLTPNWA